jgi:hypothetical protein
MAMEPHVYWLIQAYDRLENAVAPSPAKGVEEELSEKLRGTFPDAEAIIVIDRVPGFRDRPDKHILRVEVFRKGDPSAHVIKFATPQELSQELQAWESCKRRSNERGRVLVKLRPGKPISDKPNEYQTIIYEDVYQTLRAAEVVPLERAVLECYRWGVPTIDSIGYVLGQIFTEMRDWFYMRSKPESPTERLRERFEEWLKNGQEAWTSGDAALHRKEVLDNLPASIAEFIDPCEYMTRVLKTPENLPEMQMGYAHGDLHGRNVLVGIVDGEARWPAMFDYEDMGCAN